MYRRSFLEKAGCAFAAASLTTTALATRSVFGAAPGNATPANRDFPIAIFAKVYQSHTFEQLADAVAEMDADGVEATVRAKGHIEPEKAAEQVPAMVEALARRQKRLLIAATDVTRVSAENRRFLKVLSDHGVKTYRLGYYRYVSGTPRLAQLREFASQAKELAGLNAELGLTGLLQNHSGEGYVGNLIWDYAMLLDGISPEAIGVGLDLRHLRVEISGSYLSAIEALRPSLRSVYAKDAIRKGDGKENVEEVPLGQGMVNRELFRTVWQGLKPIPLALHVEYFGQKALEPDKIEPVTSAYRRDTATLRSWMSP